MEANRGESWVQANKGLANGAEERTTTDWNAIDWRKVEKSVSNLRRRIFRASKEGDHRKVRSLQKLVLRSYANALLSVRRVTQINAGRNTPGVDMLVVKTPKARGELVDQIRSYQPWKARDRQGGCTYRKQTASSGL
jgi:RNA-directed DNA polymerase